MLEGLKGDCVRSLWSDREASLYEGDLAQRVYTSRLLGQDPTLVLHGGGNTSVKIRQCNILGEQEEILYVKGSGWDLATIEEAGFSPVRMDRLLGLARLPELSDAQMAAELKSNMTDASAPAPSVEAILHAILPYRFVDHTHADVIVTLTNTPRGAEQIRAALGDAVIVVPYVMPGFKLARLCGDLFPREVTARTNGVVLLNHGLFTFGETARESYETTIQLVDRAEQFLRAQGAWHIPAPQQESAPPSTEGIARLRGDISRSLGAPAILITHEDGQALNFARRDDLQRVSQQGPATPDHVIRTKRVPLVGRDVQAYERSYNEYFVEHSARSSLPLTMLDPAPRVILDPLLGLLTVGRSVREAAVAADVYRHTIDIIARAELLDAYQALPPEDIFDVEYWDLEQAKLRRSGAPPPHTGEVALVTGAASGIGRACVEELIAAGAAVIALDVNPSVTQIFDRQEILPAICDVTDGAAVEKALEAGVLAFGGLDMLVLNAGVFPAGNRIEALTGEEWDRVMRVNLDANLALLRMAHGLLKIAPNGGRVVVIGSKNVPAPGPGAAAYSASKAALTQLARVAALEWGRDHIRVNVLHPNAVFDTGIWTQDVLQARAQQYGMTVEEYKRNNVLGVEVTSTDVARLAVALCSALFEKTTGAQIPVDGGNERVI